MVDQYVEVTDAPGCFTRLKDSIARVGIGVLMIIISFPLLFWNEGRAVKRAQDLEFGRGAVVSADAGKVDTSKSGKLLHLTGSLKATKPVKDPQFGVEADAIGLQRSVEMYQWVEDSTTKKKGDKNVTTYDYSKEWKSTEVNSSNFKKRAGHENPPMPADSESFYTTAKLGAYGVAKSLASKWPTDQAYTLEQSDLGSFPKLGGRTATLDGSGAYYGDPSTPKVGDVRIAYSIGPPGEATAVAGLEKSTLTAFSHPEMNDTIAMLKPGTHSADAMFTAAEDANTMLTWILRFAGFFLMFIGFNLLFGPIDTIVRMIPLIGGVIDFGTTLLAGLLAAAFSFITIAIGWIFYRPLIGILLLVAGLGFIGLMVFLSMKAKK